MKKPFRFALQIVFLLLALTIGGLIHRQSNSDVDPTSLPPPGVLSQTASRAFSSLCELSENASSYRGREIRVVVFHVGLLSVERLSVLSDCSDGDSVSAQITFAGQSRLPEALLDQLADLMFLHKESTDGAYGRLIIDGRLDESVRPGGYDFRIVATEVRVEIYPQPSTDNEVLQGT